MSINIEAGSRSKVLIVDDDPGIRNLYQAFLEKFGFMPIITGTPGEGFVLFEANRDTHLVILDRDLPEMRGEIVAQRIREISGKTDDPYILMITGDNPKELDIPSIFARGVDELMYKPIVPMVRVIQTLTLANQRFQNPRS